MEKNNLNIITFSALILVIGISFTVGLISGLNLSNKGRYQIINANGIVILLDKYTGLTWRNVNSYDNILLQSHLPYILLLLRLLFRFLHCLLVLEELCLLFLLNFVLLL